MPNWSSPFGSLWSRKPGSGAASRPQQIGNAALDAWAGLVKRLDRMLENDAKTFGQPADPDGFYHELCRLYWATVDHVLLQMVQDPAFLEGARGARDEEFVRRYSPDEDPTELVQRVTQGVERYRLGFAVLGDPAVDEPSHPRLMPIGLAFAAAVGKPEDFIMASRGVKYFHEAYVAGLKALGGYRTPPAGTISG